MLLFSQHIPLHSAMLRLGYSMGQGPCIHPKSCIVHAFKCSYHSKIPSKNERVSIIKCYYQLSPKWTSISRMTGFNKSTYRSFWYRYKTKPQLEIIRGRLSALSKDEEITMQNASYDFELAWSTIKGISNDYTIKYMKKTPFFQQEKNILLEESIFTLSFHV